MYAKVEHFHVKCIELVNSVIHSKEQGTTDEHSKLRNTFCSAFQ